MRIIAGSLGGRSFESPHSFKTHPMSDKIRGALFNILGDIEGLTVLDAFAGSGAIGFEALSRGAARVLLLDNDRVAQQVIMQNIQALGVGRQAKLVAASVSAWVQTNAEARFDLVMCDPPYNDVQLPAIRKVANCISTTGTLVLSWPGSNELPEFTGLKKVAHRTYGDAQLAFYQRTA